MYCKSIINATESLQEIIFPGPKYSFWHILTMYMYWKQLETNIIIPYKL